jgi:hypothetical protein
MMLNDLRTVSNTGTEPFLPPARLFVGKRFGLSWKKYKLSPFISAQYRLYSPSFFLNSHPESLTVAWANCHVRAPEGDDEAGTFNDDDGGC